MIRLMEMVKYRHIRPYTKVEMKQITDDYLRNNKFKEVMPNFLKDKDDVLNKLQQLDKLEFLSDDELSKLNNSKVANMKATTKDPGDSMKTDSFNWKDIVSGIQSVPPKKFTPPLVVQDKKGNLFISIFFHLKENYPPFNEFSVINPPVIGDTFPKNVFLFKFK